MVLFRESKIAFLMPAKTGSTTAVSFLYNSKQATVFDATHARPLDALKLAPDLAECKVYCFLRNPAERFISSLIMDADKHYFAKNFLNALSRENVTDCKDFVDVYYVRNKAYFGNAFFIPQSQYFEHLNVTALDFDNYEAELRKATEGLGLDSFSIGWENKGAHDKKKEMAKKVVSFVKKEYAQDCALWEEKFGRRMDA